MGSDRFLDKQIQRLMEQHGLNIPEEITLLSDVDLFRTSGVGIATQRMVRDLYPFDRQAHENLVERKENDKLRPHREKLVDYFPQMREGVTLHFGHFHEVVGVQVNDSGILVHQQGRSLLLSVKPVFLSPVPKAVNSLPEDSTEQELIDMLRAAQSDDAGSWAKIEVSGEFGHVSDVDDAEMLEGLEIKDVMKILIRTEYEDEDDDFHTRILCLHLANGLRLEWELFCEEKRV